jgi:hypothetical protein
MNRRIKIGRIEQLDENNLMIHGQRYGSSSSRSIMPCKIHVYILHFQYSAFSVVHKRIYYKSMLTKKGIKDI